MRRDDVKIPVADYLAYFRQHVRDDSTVVFHNADIYPPAYENVHLVSYRRTNDFVTVADRMLPQDPNSWSHRSAYDDHRLAEGKVDARASHRPGDLRGNPITWRNYEASYDVSELEPSSRAHDTYVLQEYFVPVDSIDVFVPRMRRILQAHEVNAVNVRSGMRSLDPGTYCVGAERGVRLRAVLQAAHRPGVTPRSVALDARADRRRRSKRRTVLPALPAGGDARSSPRRIRARLTCSP